jgi:hypothetical protein
MATPLTTTRSSASPQACAGCGSPLAEDQRYCLNCGARAGDPRLPGEELLAHVAADEAPPATGPAGYAAAPGHAPPRQRDWMPLLALGALGALGLLALVLVIGVLIGRSGSNSGSSAPQVITIGGGAAAGAAPAAGATAGTFTSDWSGGDGWTIEIGTLPKASTTAAQVAAAKSAATGKGVAAVGALDSDTYASLPSGEYVLYSGTFTSKGAAKKALAKVKAAYPGAKVVQVSSAGATGGAGGSSAGGTGSTPVAPASGASGSTYEKQSAKSPTQQSTGNGPPPAPDHKKAGGGSSGTTIG